MAPNTLFTSCSPCLRGGMGGVYGHIIFIEDWLEFVLPLGGVALHCVLCPGLEAWARHVLAFFDISHFLVDGANNAKSYCTRSLTFVHMGGLKSDDNSKIYKLYNLIIYTILGCFSPERFSEAVIQNRNKLLFWEGYCFFLNHSLKEWYNILEKRLL